MSRRFNHRFACASHSSLLEASRRRVHRLAPFSLASGIDDWSLPWRECCSSSHLEGWELRPSLSQQLSMQIICTAARPLIAQFRTNESHVTVDGRIASPASASKPCLRLVTAHGSSVKESLSWRPVNNVNWLGSCSLCAIATHSSGDGAFGFERVLVPLPSL
jgi:hypothetical protein